MNRFARIVLASLALSTFALPALAETGKRAEHAERRGEKGAKPQFPMPAADFQALVAKRSAKVHARVEAHITKKNLPADKANEVRAKLAAAEAVINQEVAKVVADGTVTADEAKHVRQVARAQAPHKGHKGKGEKKGA